MEGPGRSGEPGRRRPPDVALIRCAVFRNPEDLLVGPPHGLGVPSVVAEQRPTLGVDPDSVREKTPKDDDARGDQKAQFAFLVHQTGSAGWATSEENPTLARP